MAQRSSFALVPHLLGGLHELGSVDPASGDLSLELGISLWLRRSRTPVGHARTALLAVRSALLDVAGFEPSDEPVPLVGVSPRQDVVTLVIYLGRLLERAAAASGRAPYDLVEPVVSALSAAPVDEALGA